MKRLRRRYGVLLGIVCVVIALALILPYFLKVDRYRPWIVSMIARATGRDVALGAIQARFLPRPAFVLEDFSLGNPPGFAPGAVFSATTVRGNLSWLSLLRGQLRFSSLELVHPKINLLEDRAGRTNYDFSGLPRGAGADSRGAATLPEPSGWVFAVDTVALTDAEISLARIAGPDPPTPVFHALNFSASLRRASSDGSLVKQWETNADLAGVAIQFSGLAADLQIHSGYLKVQKGEADSQFEADLGKAARLKGNLQVPDLDQPVVNFQVNTSLLKLDEVLPAAKSADPPPARESPQHRLLAQGRLTAERARWGPYEASQASAEVRLFTDRVEAWPVTMGLSGGSLGLSVWLDDSANPPRFSANVMARGIDVGRLFAADPANRGKISGRGDLTMQLFGSPDAKWENSLTGKGNFVLRDGDAQGFDFSGALKTLGRVTQVLTLGGAGGGMGGVTHFSQIVGDLSLARGRLSSQHIHMDADIGAVDLRGSCSLDGALNYDGQAALSSGGGNPGNVIGNAIGGVFRHSVGRMAVPIMLRGTMSHPLILPGGTAPNFGSSSSNSQTRQPSKQNPRRN